MLLVKHHPIGHADYQELVTVNGAVAPVIPIRPGEAQFWQIGNIGAEDGYFVPKPIRMEELILEPGQRVAVIVVGSQPGRHPFKSVEFKFNERQPSLPEVNLGTVDSQGTAADIQAAEARVSAQHVNAPLYVDIVRSSPIAHTRTFAFSVNPEKTIFFINDKVFEENRTDVTVKLGDIEEWTILNKDSQYHHFHIHQTGFLVTEVNGHSTHFDGLRDTFSVPLARNGQPGEAKLIIPFTDPQILWKFVFHCHVVKHEDKGMMMTVQVVR